MSEAAATRVDFYLLPTVEALARMHFACRLADKALASGRRLHVLTGDRAECEMLSRLLWTHGDTSFRPHAITHASDPDYPVTLGYTADSLTGGSALLNLAPDVPDGYASFEQIAEIVDENPDIKARSRAHYRLYRNHGCSLQHHALGQTS